MPPRPTDRPRPQLQPGFHDRDTRPRTGKDRRSEKPPRGKRQLYVADLPCWMIFVAIYAAVMRGVIRNAPGTTCLVIGVALAIAAMLHVVTWLYDTARNRLVGNSALEDDVWRTPKTIPPWRLPTSNRTGPSHENQDGLNRLAPAHQGSRRYPCWSRYRFVKSP